MTPALAEDDRGALVERVRTFLPAHELREVRMFGVVALMVDGAMAVAVHHDGSLLVRADPAEDARLLDSPGASRAEMGLGRSMGKGWIRVESRMLRSDAALSNWLEVALRYLARRKETPPTRRSSNSSR